MLICIGCVACWPAKDLVADVINGLVEFGRTTRCIADLCGTADATTALPTNEIDCEGFAHIQRCWIDAGDTAAIDQRNFHCFAAHRERRRLGGIFESELKGHVLNAITGVVDVDFIQSVGVKHVKVRAALGILKGLIVSQNSDVVGPVRLIAAKHVKVSTVNLRLATDKRCFAMA